MAFEIPHENMQRNWKWTLAFHGKTFLPGICYMCDVCKTKFVLYKQLYDHKRKFHTSLQCDYCDVTISSEKNTKRHVSLKQRGLTPSRAKSLEVSKLPKTEKRFECDECKKTFYDKSTLNRHKKVHTFVCKLVRKYFRLDKIWSNTSNPMKEKQAFLNWKRMLSGQMC